MNEFWNIQTYLDEKIEEYGSDFKGDENNVKDLIRDLKLKWNDIETVSNGIFQLILSKANGEEKEAEHKYFKKLKNEYASSLFKAK